MRVSTYCAVGLLLVGLVGGRPAPAQSDATAHSAVVVALYPQMLAAVQQRDLPRARVLCLQAIGYEPRDPVHRYNLGCIEALAGNANAAFAALNQATALGYADANSLRTDADLAALHADSRFGTVVQATLRNAGTAAPPVATVATVGPARPRAVAAPTAAVPARPAPATAVAQPVAGKMASGRPLGLFFMTRYWIATRSLEKSAYYFTADGHVYVDPTGFSAAELAAQKRGSYGTFQVAGGTLSVQWSDGQKSVSKLEDPKADAFTWDTGLFVAAHPFRSAQQLLGTFSGGNSMTTSAGSIAATGTYTFRSDGTYTRDGVASASSVSDGSVLNTGAQGQAAGRWQLNGFVLTLTDNQGRTQRGVSFPFDTDRMYFAGTLYKRQ